MSHCTGMCLKFSFFPTSIIGFDPDKNYFEEYNGAFFIFSIPINDEKNPLIYGTIVVNLT